MTVSVYHKVGQELLQIGDGNLLQIEAVIITNWVRYHKEGYFHCRVGQVLQIGEIITK